MSVDKSTDDHDILHSSYFIACFEKILTSGLNSGHTYLVPRPHQKNWEKGLITLAKIPVYAVSAVFIWSRQITFVRYQLDHIM